MRPTWVAYRVNACILSKRANSVVYIQWIVKECTFHNAHSEAAAWHMCLAMSLRVHPSPLAHAFSHFTFTHPLSLHMERKSTTAEHVITAASGLDITLSACAMQPRTALSYPKLKWLTDCRSARATGSPNEFPIRPCTSRSETREVIGTPAHARLY
jgi:hypothetical protein